jgi:5-oxoprolinase (ATP-hydrolysing)
MWSPDTIIMPSKEAAGETQGWSFWIDRGGTFTDVVARAPNGRMVVRKLLSEDPGRYDDAAVAGICAVLGQAGESLASARIEAVKMGTTVATNALLERQGEATLLAITRGFGDALAIGYQNRPRLFDRRIVKPQPLHRAVVEIDERVSADGEVLRPLDLAAARTALQAAYDRGLRAIAVVLMHGYRYPDHERTIAALARDIGFGQVSVSHEVSSLIKLVGRGDTTVADAYLSPILRRYVDRAAAALPPGVRLLFMQSSGGLTDAHRFRGADAVLSARRWRPASARWSASTWAAPPPTSPTLPGNTNEPWTPWWPGCGCARPCWPSTLSPPAGGRSAGSTGRACASDPPRLGRGPARPRTATAGP